MRSALAVEWLKARRARTFWMAGLAQVVLPPLFAALLVASAQPGEFGMGAKANGLGLAGGWQGYLSALAALMTGWTVITGGLLATWLFGREFVQGTVGSLFATTIPRARLAAAKVVILVGWGVAAAIAGIPVALLVGLSYGSPTPRELALSVTIAAVVALTTLLAPAAGLVATLARSYLPALGVLIALTLAAQMVAGLDAGRWFPWSIPALWALPQIPTAANANATTLMPSWHLIVVAFTGAALTLAVIAAWRRLRLA